MYRSLDHGTGPVGEPGLLLIFREQELGEHSKIIFGDDGKDSEPSLEFVLVFSTEPACVDDVDDTRDRAQTMQVTVWKRSDQRDLVQRHQSIGAGHVDTQGERLSDRAEIGEQDEGDQDRQHRE